MRKARNWDVHTGRDIWAERPNYYIGCCYLTLQSCLSFLGTSHEAFYGAKNSKKVGEYLDNIQRGQDLEYNKLIGEAKQRYTQLSRDGLSSAPVAPVPPEQAEPSLTNEKESIRTENRECPACKRQGQLTFVPWTHSDPILDPNTREMNLIRTYMPTLFHCSTCSLTLSGKMLDHAKMDALLEHTEHLDAFEYLNIGIDMIREAFSAEELLTRDELDSLEVGREQKNHWEEDELYDDRD